MEHVQRSATRPTSLADSPMFSKIKSWLERKKKTEAID